MKCKFQGWTAVAKGLDARAISQRAGNEIQWLNDGQCASLHAIAERITKNGLVVADEVGMGKTRIAVELARSVTKCGGRVAILVPPGLGYQWQAELREGGIDVPPILRSLGGYLAAWKSEDNIKQEPWFDHSIVMVSHAFTNWRLGENTPCWRWALLPEVYARWRSKTDHRFPRGYHGNEDLSDDRVRNAAQWIVDANAKCLRLDRLLKDVRWPDPLNASNYSRNNDLREWLEFVVGLGLGVFDLVIIDEAHKSRGMESNLSRLLNKVVLPFPDARRLALTATPIELEASQWRHTLSRIGLDNAKLDSAQQAVDQYAEAAKRVRQSWRSSQEARDAYGAAAKLFHAALTPYLLRRDKREDPSVQKFCSYSGLPINAYRQEKEVTVETVHLTEAWRQAVCAAEALSLVTQQAKDPLAKRLRLTLGNGHGIGAFMDQIKLDVKLDQRQQEHDEAECDIRQHSNVEYANEPKREQRAKWWLDSIARAFSKDVTLYEHPAITAAVRAIEEVTGQGEKVLVFGRFTLPLRALVDLLNAREMLRRLQIGQSWPQAKVHGERSGDQTHSEWAAVRAAHYQLGSALSLETLDDMLEARYNLERQSRERGRGRLVANIEQGLNAGSDYGSRIKSIFLAFKRSIGKAASPQQGERHPLALVSRALAELVDSSKQKASSSEYATAFSQLIDAASDRDDADEKDNIDDDRATELWQILEERLHEEYNRPEGGFARLMFGETKPESRRMIQLAFNRPNSFPRVLVAQSIVGREGLNLHKSCRTVVMLHPEWNPGVVEQQIGRVDRVGSFWSKKLDEEVAAGKRGEDLPRIDVRPVIFRGTYDEHNWKVLRDRWDDFRAQLHGIVIPQRLADNDRKTNTLIDEIEKMRPTFSPVSN